MTSNVRKWYSLLFWVPDKYFWVFWKKLLDDARVHSSVPRHFEKMFTATLLALGTRLVKFHFSSLVKISVFASFALKIEQLSIKWAQECLKLKIWVLIRLKHAWKPKLEVWNFTSLVPRARSVAVNIFSKCHGKDEWTLVQPSWMTWTQSHQNSQQSEQDVLHLRKSVHLISFWPCIQQSC